MEMPQASELVALVHPVLPATSPQRVINSPFSSPSFQLARAGNRQLVVNIKATDKDDLVLL